MSRLRSQNVVLLLFFVAMTGCDNGPNDKGLMARLQAGWSAFVGDSSSNPEPSSTPTTEPEEFSSNAAKNAKANSEILKEMFTVIQMKEPKDRGEFGNWADTMNQGATIEGIYNGLTHSADYRKLEVLNRSASIEALHAFGEELAYLEVELPVATEFDASSAAPLPSIESPTGAGPGGKSGVVEVIDFNKEKTPLDPPSDVPKPDLKVLAEKYSKLFVGASIFTMKRVLGDEALKVFGSKAAHREKMALWYSKSTVRLAQKSIDFGVALRSNPDEGFHFKWAVQTPDDRIKWEILNRLHRVLNEANRAKQ